MGKRSRSSDHPEPIRAIQPPDLRPGKPDVLRQWRDWVIEHSVEDDLWHAIARINQFEFSLRS